MALYFKDKWLQLYYQKIQDPESLEDIVDHFWGRLLGFYFRIEDFTIEREARVAESVDKKRADLTIQIIKHGSPTKVVLMEDKRKNLEDSTQAWEEALTQLTEYLVKVRGEPGQAARQPLYSAVNIGTQTRFYELRPREFTCIPYVDGLGYTGEKLELRTHETTIDRILTNLVKKCKATTKYTS